MKYNHYRFKFYLNAMHAIYLGGVLGQEHPHTWEITLDAIKLEDSFVLFESIETYIEEFLRQYQNQCLNQVPPFNVTNPTLENICGYFKEVLQDRLYRQGWVLLSIEISETPTRSYLIDIADELEVVHTKKKVMPIAKPEAQEEAKAFSTSVVKSFVKGIKDKLKSKQ